jgi:hypothetical protein
MINFRIYAYFPVTGHTGYLFIAFLSKNDRASLSSMIQLSMIRAFLMLYTIII